MRKPQSHVVLHSERYSSLLILQEPTRLIPLETAAKTLLIELTGTPGNRLPLRLRRHIDPMLRKACDRMATGEVLAVEVINTRFGNIAMLGVYRNMGLGDDVSGTVVWITIRAYGKTCRDEFDPSEYVRARAMKAWQCVEDTNNAAH